ncbi:MAG: MFS transporter [Rhodospirillaceae bacterium]|jgi:MFS family permease|nr:MFS transporter [Rhodospirillaceae bacterium]MBT5191538.1 MFS transporter [Rhodospirillaceae bacterium]MBT5898104.1 MFS transporter [Rhodospirillaceae bacterium]MBT6429470.1 MFS transporter [Rhodospirillaceae bacterium]
MSQQNGSIEVQYGWVIIFVSLLIHSIGLGAPNVLFVTLKPIAAEMGSDRAMPSLAYSLMMLGTGIGGLGMGWWLDKRGVMEPVLFGAVMIGLGSFLAAQSMGKWNLYLANGILIGLLGKAAMIAPLVANATRWFDRRRGLAVSIIASGQGVAGVCWPPAIRYITDNGGWREAYQFYGVFVLVTMIPLALLLRPKPPAAPADAGQSHIGADGRILGLPSNMVQLGLWFAVVGCCAAMAMPTVHLFSYATDLGFPAVRAAELLSLLFGAAFFSRIAFGMLADRIGGVRTLLIGSGCQAAMLLVFSQVTSLYGLYIAAFMFGLGFAGIMPCYALIVRVLFPVNQVGWRVAGQYLFAALGMALGGWSAGVIHDLTGTYTMAFLTGFAFNVINLVLIAGLYVRQTRMGLGNAPA